MMQSQQQQQQAAHPMLSRVGGSQSYGPSGMAIIGPSSLSNHGPQYSRSLIDDDSASSGLPPSSHRSEESIHFDSSGFPSLLPPNVSASSSGLRDNGVEGMMSSASHTQPPTGPVRSSQGSSQQLNSIGDTSSSLSQVSGDINGVGKTELRGDGKYGLLGLLDVIRMSDKVNLKFNQPFYHTNYSIP
jgi:hypothetical protein